MTENQKAFGAAVILFFGLGMLIGSIAQIKMDQYSPPRITIKDQDRSQIGTTLIQEGIIIMNPIAATQPSEVIITNPDQVWSFWVGPDTYK